MKLKRNQIIILVICLTVVLIAGLLVTIRFIIPKVVIKKQQVQQVRKVQTIQQPQPTEVNISPKAEKYIIEIDPDFVPGIIEKIFQNHNFLQEKAFNYQKEKDDFKKYLSNAIMRLVKIGESGISEAPEAWVELNESGGTEKLLVSLIKQRDCNEADFIELNNEIFATAFVKGDLVAAMGAVDDILEVQPENIEALCNKGYLHRLSNQLYQAERCYKELADIAERNQETEWQAVALGNLGDVYQERNEPENAKEMYIKAIELFQQGDEMQDLGFTCFNLGIVYQIIGDPNSSEQAYLQALEAFEEIDMDRGLANTYGNLGILYRVKGDFEKAQEMYRLALEIAEKHDMPEIAANQYGNLGNLYFSQDEYDEAKKYFLKSLETFKQMGSIHGQASALKNLGIIYERLDDIEQTKDCWEKAIALYKQVEQYSEILKIQSWLNQLAAQSAQSTEQTD